MGRSVVVDHGSHGRVDYGSHGRVDHAGHGRVMEDNGIKDPG